LQAALATISVGGAVHAINRRLPRRIRQQIEETRDHYVASGGEPRYLPPERAPSLLESNRDPIRGRARLRRDGFDFQLAHPAQFTWAVVPPLAYVLVAVELGRVALRATRVAGPPLTLSFASTALLFLASCFSLTVAWDLHRRRQRSADTWWRSIRWVDTPAWCDVEPRLRSSIERVPTPRPLAVPTLPMLVFLGLVVGPSVGCVWAVRSHHALLMPLAALLTGVALLERDREMFSERWTRWLERFTDPLWRAMVLPIRGAMAIHRLLELALATLELVFLTGLAMYLATATLDPTLGARTSAAGAAAIVMIGSRSILGTLLDALGPRTIRPLSGCEVRLHLEEPAIEQRLRLVARLGWVVLAISVAALLTGSRLP
jgi:hypothetical protein